MARLAILARDGSFSDRWISEVRSRGVDAIVLSPYEGGLFALVADCTAIIWHPDHERAEDLLLIAPILQSAEAAGKVTFPDFGSRWHFDDKIAQAYLLAAIGAPTPSTRVFVTRQEALDYIQTADLPLVAKLKRGAGSANVRLLRSVPEGRAYVSKAFGAGHEAVSGYFTDVRTRVTSTGSLSEMFAKLRRLPQSVMRRRALSRAQGRERGYVLLQEFMPGNEYDVRITVIGDRAFGFRRFVRPNDFRASGSRNVDYSPEAIDSCIVQVAFTTAQKLNAGCVAIDFVTDLNGQPMIVELSFGFNPVLVERCPGYWDRRLEWHEGSQRPEEVILDDVLARIGSTT